jgi:hypothetical protein
MYEQTLRLTQRRQGATVLSYIILFFLGELCGFA